MTKGTTASTPTKEAYAELQLAYDFFNRELFEGRLPACLITYARKGRTYGYFWAEKWDGSGKRVADEIAMNPQHFANEDFKWVLSVLVHEMVHLEQHHFGKPGRGRYHNKQWGEMMDRIDLTPSNTGEPGGKRVGDQMMHIVEPGGRFDRAASKLVARGFKLSWSDRHQKARRGKGRDHDGNTRTKYTCPGCGLNIWAKPEIKVRCESCDKRLRAVA